MNESFISNHSQQVYWPKRPTGKIGKIWASLGMPGQGQWTSVIMNTLIVFLLWFYYIVQKITSNSQTVLEIFKLEKWSNLIGREQSHLGKPKGTPHIMNTFTVFLLWFYNIVQKISSNSETILQIFNFEKSSNLIGQELFGPYFENQSFPEHAVFAELWRMLSWMILAKKITHQWTRF